MMFRSFLSQSVDLLFPKICRFCGDPFREGLSNILCEKCWGSIRPYRGILCPRCGVSVGQDDDDLTGFFCLDCEGENGAIDKTWSYGPYEGALRIVHHGFKFEGLQSLATPMAVQVAGVVPKPDVEWLVPVPVFAVKERERGYNPALDLAIALSDLWAIPVQNGLRKIKNTPAQMSLSQKERLKNPRGAFATNLGGKIPSKVLLVDDVFTTGATLEECAGILKKAGVDWVGAVVWGRTPKNFSL